MQKRKSNAYDNLMRKILLERKANKAAVVHTAVVDGVRIGKLSRNPGVYTRRDGEGFNYVRG